MFVFVQPTGQPDWEVYTHIRGILQFHWSLPSNYQHLKYGSGIKVPDQWLSSIPDRFNIRLILTIAVTLIGKVIGFLRLQQIATVLGISLYADVLMIVLQLVWLVETVLVSGAVIPSIIAQIYRLDSSSGAKVSTAFFLHTALACSTISILFAAIIYIFSPQLAVLLAPGLGSEGMELFSLLILVSALTPFALTLSHFFGLVNRLLHNGVWYSITQIVTNSCAIAGLSIGYNIGGAESAAIYMLLSLVISSFLVCGIQCLAIPSAPRTQLWRTFRTDLVSALQWRDRLSFWRGVLALLLATLVNELYIYIDFYFASQFFEGGVSTLSYASRLATLTNMVVVTTAFVILEPRWANATATSIHAWNETIKPDILAIINILAVPVAILYSFPADVTEIVYQSQNFALEDQNRLNSLTRIFAFGVLALGLTFITTRTLIIAGAQNWIVLVSLIGLPCKILLSLNLIPSYGIEGLAIATIFTLIIQVAVNVGVLVRFSIPMNIKIKDLLVITASYVGSLSAAFLLQDYVVSYGFWAFLGGCICLILINLAIALLGGVNYVAIFKRGKRGA